MKIIGFCDKIIETSFVLLFFLTPLFLTPFNYELFEFNKMLLVYGLTIIITGCWLIKMIYEKRIIFQRTPLDLPILLFLLSQIISTFFSIDRHVSLFGYYSRFNGGLVSTIAYISLYYSFVSNFSTNSTNFTTTVSNSTKPQRSTISTILKFLKISLLSALVVSLYGVLEHFGIDKNLWVQDVQNRVFSTLGQPNWLAAYLAIIIPIAIAFSINSKSQILNTKQITSHKSQKTKLFGFWNLENWNLFRNSNLEIRNLFLYLLLTIFYLCLLYTKSRSGFLGLWFGLIIFAVFLIFHEFRSKNRPQNHGQYNAMALYCQRFLLIIFLFFILTFVEGSPFEQLNRFTLPQILSFSNSSNLPNSTISTKAAEGGRSATVPSLEGGTESAEIRKIVWTGAFDITRHYPLFGTGPETFAFAYYQYRPIAHNLVSEWDFLYNKAHNEYLNYAATTGFVGIGTYLLLIGWFIAWSFKKIFVIARKSRCDIGTTKQSLHTEFSSTSRHSGEPADSAGDSRIKNGFWTSQNDDDVEIAAPFGLAMTIGLLSGYISILVTNFFGFSVVVVSLYFWLIPAMLFVLFNSPVQKDNGIIRPAAAARIASFLIFLLIFYFLSFVFRFWLSDFYFNRASTLAKTGRQQQAYEFFHRAIDLNPAEPFFRDELSYTTAVLSVAAFEQKEASLSSQLLQEAILQNQEALSISPKNLNFWKTRTKVFYVLSTLDQKYLQTALLSILKAREFAPTDPKITYNAGLLYGQLNDQKMAIKTLEEAVSLKPNYSDAHYALALFYKETGKVNEAINELQYILDHIPSNDAQIKAKLEEWQK